MNWLEYNWSQEVSKIVILIVIIIGISTGYKIISRFINKTGKRLQLEPHAINALRLLLRIGAVIAVFLAIFNFYELPTDWFIGGSALIGAFLGFGSSQTINNFVAGLYVLITQPFKVKDYVRIGELEGQVEEITINYTHLYTPTFNLLKVPNTQVMNSRVLNLTHEGFIKYTFTISFDHQFDNNTLLKKVINPAIEEFHNKYQNIQLRKPEAYMELVNRLERVFLIRFFIPKGDAHKLYRLQPELLDLILKRWDDIKKN
jgi:small-conductance mechanosensitive channel